MEMLVEHFPVGMTESHTHSTERLHATYACTTLDVSNIGMKELGGVPSFYRCDAHAV